MNSIYILEIPGLNMGGDAWVWKIFLSFKKDKTYSVGAKMFSKGKIIQEILEISSLKNSKEIADALKELLSDINFMDFLGDEDTRAEALESCIFEIESYNKALSIPRQNLIFR